MINSSLFDAKSYLEFLELNNNLCNKTFVFKQIKEEYINKKKNKKQKFTKFCLNYLNSKCNDLSIDIKNFESDNIFYEDIKKEILSIMDDLNLKFDDSDMKNINNISNILQYMTIKIKENKFYKDSNCEDFFQILENQIKKAKNYVEINFKKNLIESFEYFDMILNKDIDSDNSKNQKEKPKIIQHN